MDCIVCETVVQHGNICQRCNELVKALKLVDDCDAGLVDVMDVIKERELIAGASFKERERCWGYIDYEAKLT